MKKILFIVPDSLIGGASSSLLCIISQCRERLGLDPYIFAISDVGNCFNGCDACIVPSDTMLSAFYAPFKFTQGKKRLLTLAGKVTRKALSLVHLDNKFNEYIIDRSIKRLKSYEYDVVIAFQEGDSTFYTSRIQHPNKIAWIHGAYEGDRRTEHTAYSNFRKIVCVCGYSHSGFCQIHPDLAERAHVINNFIDYKSIYKNGLEENLDKRYSTDTLTLLFVGRLSKVKRFTLIPTVAATLVEKGLNFKWYVCGPIVDEDEWKQFAQDIDRFKLKDVVIWLGAKSNPYPYFRTADIFITLSKSEACPMVFNEAKVFGLPVISTDFPTAKEFLSDYDNSYIATVGSIAEAIAGNAKRLAANRKKINFADFDRYNDRIISDIQNLL